MQEKNERAAMPTVSIVIPVKNEQKYIGIILQVNGIDYFAPLSSFKLKHKTMDEMLDFIKIMQLST